MTRNGKVHACTVFADERPTGESVAGHLGWSVDGLNLTKVPGGLVVDKVASIRRDGESAAGVENDVDEVVGGVCAGKECRNKVGIEIGARQMRIQSLGQVTCGIGREMKNC